jgi:hypothetical protein
MLNNYNKIYEEMLAAFAELHNGHIHLKERTSNTSALEVKKALQKIKATTMSLRNEVLVVQRQYNVEREDKRKEYKELRRSEKEREAQRKKLKRIKNEHPSRFDRRV